MDVDGAQKLLKSSLAAMIVAEFDLFALGAGERALVHQLGLRVRRRVSVTFDVDVEYDREGPERDLKLLPPPQHGVPDIVVHQRGHGGPECNLLVVEVKRAWHGRSGSLGDIRKVTAAMVRFGFRVGAVLEFGATIDTLDPRWSWWTWDYHDVLADRAPQGSDSVHVVLHEAGTPVFKPAELAHLLDDGAMRWHSKDRPTYAMWDSAGDRW